METIFCKSCGREIETNSNFCRICGAAVGQDSQIVFQFFGHAETAGIFTKKIAEGSILFLENRMVVTSPIEADVTKYRYHEVKAKELYSVSYFNTLSWVRSKVDESGEIFTVEASNQKPLKIRLEGHNTRDIKKLLSDNNIKCYKNEIEKETGIETGDESALLGYVDAKHVYGLPIAEGADCQIAYSNDRYYFLRNGKEFLLAKDKVQDIAVKTSTEISSTYVSDIGDAIIGAYFFGIGGAAIGGKAREKRSEVNTYFLIFDYKDKGIQSFISFHVEERNIKWANAIAQSYVSTAKERERFEL